MRARSAKPTLTPDVLISAYAQGIFPMGSGGEIRWFSPDPRAILPLEGFRASRTLMQTFRNGGFEIRTDTAFAEVMRHCAERPEGTWITRPIVEAYTRLHQMGLAHSLEAWKDGELAGGLYGVHLGGAYFGESMFHVVRDASKVALVGLVQRMRERGFALLDVQFATDHLMQFGTVEIPRGEYLERLAAALKLRCTWSDVAGDKKGNDSADESPL